MATHSSIFAWRIPGTEEPSGLPFMGSHRVGHDWSNLAAAAAAAVEGWWLGGRSRTSKLINQWLTSKKANYFRHNCGQWNTKAIPMKHHLASDLSWTKEGKQGSTTRNCWNVEALPLSLMHGPFNVGSLLLDSAGTWEEGTTREGWQSRPMLSAQRHSSGLLLLILKQILTKSKKILWMKRWPSSKTQIRLVYT